MPRRSRDEPCAASHDIRADRENASSVTHSQKTVATQRPLQLAGLFAGIGGIELGMHQEGHESVLLCEIDPAAASVLQVRFPGVPIVGDVRELEGLPAADLLAAGFPCQDLSQAGRTAGIRGRNSGLVEEVFRLLDGTPSVQWLLLENVPFMLQLERGGAMRYLTHMLERLGFRWAYRVVDARAFGIPQRRKRVLLLASREHDPRPILLNEDVGEPPTDPSAAGRACGFYWTEGTRGLGWADDAIPTLKGGSSIGIPSPPAIRMPSGEIVIPEIRDAERLQGFPTDWTRPAENDGRRGTMRWKLVGNAVSVPVARWVGKRLRTDEDYDPAGDDRMVAGSPWPMAAWGGEGETHAVPVSGWPVRLRYRHLEQFLRYDTKPLSERATLGFWRRAQASSLRFPDGFLDDIEAHLDRVRAAAGVAA
jgi:DNA (cytosine-5)-methyltransferase 1